VGQGGEQAGVVGGAETGDVEGGAVIDAGADEGQADGDVDAVFDPEVLDGDEALVVVLGHHGVEGSGAGSHEDGVGGPGSADVDAFAPRGFDGGGDDVQVLTAEQAVLPCVGIEAGDSDAGGGQAAAPQRAMGETDDVEYARGGDRIDRGAQ
jgi:hypothetical protein